MKPPRSLPLIPAIALAGGLIFFGTGCGNLFVPKHKVLVDAISLPELEKPSGQSYRLVARRSVVNQVQVHVPVIKACVDAALASAGLFEAPANVPSDLFIEVVYGQDTTPRVDPAARETFLQLSARSNPTRSLDRSAGDELWDVRVAVLGIAGRMESALPLLCSVASSYVGTNTQVEAKIDVPQNSPAVAAIRETAIRSLEGKAPAAAAPANIPPMPAPSSPEPPPGT
ncbi:MAG: hypothetical protein WD941_02475 [Opitutus sp.]